MGVGYEASIAHAFLDTNLDDLHVQLHVGDPGAAGTANVAATSARVQYTSPAASAGNKTNSAVVRWDSTDAGGETISHLSFWTLGTGGTFRASAALTTPRAVSGGQPLEIPAGDLDFNLPVAS